MFTAVSLPLRVGDSLARILMIKLVPQRLRRVKDQAEDHGHTGQGSPQPRSSQGVCFEL